MNLTRMMGNRGPRKRRLRGVHAGDASTYITFTYTADQPIANGQLEFIVPVGDGWSEPARERSELTATPVIEGANIEPAEFDVDDDGFRKRKDYPLLQLDDTIAIHYGSVRICIRHRRWC